MREGIWSRGPLRFLYGIDTGEIVTSEWAWILSITLYIIWVVVIDGLSPSGTNVLKPRRELFGKKRVPGPLYLIS
jgi:hypothetical protein